MISLKPDSESNPVQWSDFSQINLRRAHEEREASQRLRGLVSNTLSRTSQDLREQADRVEEALSRRVAETEEAVRNVEIELKEVCCEHVHVDIGSHDFIDFETRRL